MVLRDVLDILLFCHGVDRKGNTKINYSSEYMRGTCKLSRPRSQIGNEVLAEIEIASE